MKIKNLLKTSFIYFSPFILILFILFCFNILVKDFNYAHKGYNIDARSMDWFSYSYFLKKKKITNYLLDLKKKDKDKGLPKVKINITEKSLNKLLSNVPSSTKQYVKAEFLVNNVKRNIKLRYFGEPINLNFTNIN